MIGLVEGDVRLPRGIRGQFTALRPDLVRNPDLTLQHLDALARRVVRDLERVAPQTALARCIGVETYLMFHAAGSIRKAFPKSSAFVAYLSSLPDPSKFLTDRLANNPVLFEAEHSWLVEAAAIARLDGEHTQLALRIRSRPPYVTFVLGLAEMIAQGVTIREARAVDAVPERLVEWSPSGLPGGQKEYLDGDVPRAVLPRIELRS